MTIPCIPNEIVAEIVLHLEDESVSESIKEGKTVSLVCRNWRPYGQALRWKRLGLVPNDCPRLLNHFSNHGGLAELVRECSIVGPMDDTPDSYSQFPELLSKFSNLQEFSLNGDVGEHYSSVIDILSRLPRLQDCNMYGFGRDKEEWLHEGAWLPRSGFKKLSCLNFSPPNPFFPIPPDSRNHLIPNQPDDEPPSENTFPVRSLILGFCSFINVDHILANRIFRHLDPTTLRLASLTESAVCFYSLAWLAKCTNLKYLIITIDIRRIRQLFPQILRFLPHFRQLVSLDISTTVPGEQIICPVPISRVLASIPPKLQHYHALSFVFLDYDTLPLRDFDRWDPLETGSPTLIHGTAPPFADRREEGQRIVVWKRRESNGRLGWCYSFVEQVESE